MTVFDRLDADWPQRRLRLLEDFSEGIVVWDFDGVVADTEPIHRDSYRAVLENRDYVLPDDYFEDLIGLTEAEIWNKIIDLGAPIELHEVGPLTLARRDYVLTASSSLLTPSWIALSLAPEFARRGSQQVIASNGNPNTISSLLTLWKIGTYFGDTHGQSKRAIISTAEATSPRLMIEDNAAYLQLGLDAGFEILGVRHSMNNSAQFPPCDQLVI